MRLATIAITTAMLAGAAAPASAVVITGLYNTGVDGSSVAVGGVGSADLHWSLGAGPAYVSGQNGTFPLNGSWLADDATSRWITPSTVAGASLDPVEDGVYFYKLSFSLAGFDPATAEFAGRFAADNGVNEIRLNGNLLAASGGNFNAWTGFGANSGFVAGDNVLTFAVSNLGQTAGNPSGLRVEFLSSDVTATAAVPEPASWAMMIAGFGLVGATMRRRKHVAA